MEIINSARTEAYCANFGIAWFSGCESCEDLSLGLGDQPYGSPMADDAPWFDQDDPDTRSFFGLYPLSVTGFEDSTYTSQPVEAVAAGGVVTVPRAATRTMVITGMLIGATDAACDSGMNWLRGALRGSPCITMPSICTGDELCFLRACPEICGRTAVEMAACLDRYQYHLHNVTTTEGPTVTAKHPISDGGAVWEVEFTMVAAKPWVCSMGLPVIHRENFKPILNLPTTYCLPSVEPDFRDPTCAALPTPPRIPDVPFNCFALPLFWDRYSVPIPAADIPRWSHAVPVIEITAPPGRNPMRMVRVRFYEDPLNRFDPEYLAECGFCAEFLITYIPPGYKIVVDGMTETITMEYHSGVWNAAQSVTSTDNTGFTWPMLSCGAGYVMTLDVPHRAVPPDVVDVTIYHRSA